LFTVVLSIFSLVNPLTANISLIPVVTATPKKPDFFITKRCPDNQIVSAQ